MGPGGETRVLVKPLDDGSLVVGLFNLSNERATVTANWSDLKLSGRQRVRDLWRQKDLGGLHENSETLVARLGVLLVRVFPTK